MGEPRAVGEYRVERPHSLPVGEVETALATGTAGLSSDAAAGRLREVGTKFGRWLDLTFMQLVLATGSPR